MPGSAESSAGVAATMTESPTAVISLPDTAVSEVGADGVLVGVCVLGVAAALGVWTGFWCFDAPRTEVPCPPPACGPSGACLAPRIDAGCAPAAELSVRDMSLAPARTHITKAPRIPAPRSVAASRRDPLPLPPARGRLCFAMNQVFTRVGRELWVGSSDSAAQHTLS